MLATYFTPAFRSLKKYKTTTFINVLGLSIGLTIFLAIALYIQDETSYDRFHVNKDHIYRAALDMGADFNNPVTPMPLAPAVMQEVPEVQKAVRLVKDRDPHALFVYGDKRFNETGYIYADPDIFNVFTFQFIHGDPNTALKEINSIVLNESTALKYFGTTDVLDKILHIEGQQNGYKVTGIVKDFPPQSHFHFNFLISFASLDQQHKDNWLIFYMFTYLLVKDNASIPQLEKKLNAIMVRNFSAQITQFSGMTWSEFLKKNGHGPKIYLQPLMQIHLHSNDRVELEQNGNYKTLYLFGIVAILILILSCVNFINLATASAANRAKEIGVRKIAGAEHKDLIKQFLAESFLLCLFSLLLSSLLLFILIPSINNFTQKDIHLTQLLTMRWLVTLPALFIIIVLVSGGYPAFYLASLRPIKTIKNEFSTTNRGLSLRRILIVMQFTIAIGLVISVLAVNRQVHYMMHKDPGFDKNQLVVLPIRASLSTSQKETIKSELLRNKGVQSVTMLNYLPGKEAYENQDVFVPEGKSTDQMVPLWFIRGDWDLLHTMGFQLIRGRNFNPQFKTDSLGYILNEEAVKRMGWTTNNAVGKTITSFGNGPKDLIQGQVIGVIKDFNFENYTQTIKPMLLGVDPHYWWNIVVRIDGQDIPATLQFLEQEWKSFQPNFPFEYSFVDQNFAQLWATDERLASILSVFTIMALVIACIGIFGLSVFTVGRRVKEIGIRKVLGSSVAGIIGVLTKEYVLLILLAFLIASPVSAYFISKWLGGFAFRVPLSPLLFIVSGFVILMLSFVTVGIKSWQAAVVNPVKSLRAE